ILRAGSVSYVRCLVYAGCCSGFCPLSLRDALPIFVVFVVLAFGLAWAACSPMWISGQGLQDPRFGLWTILNRGSCNPWPEIHIRSEEHTSELQSRFDLVCRLLLEKNKRKLTMSSLT